MALLAPQAKREAGSREPGKPDTLLCCPDSDSCPDGEAKVGRSPSKSCNSVSENKGGESCQAGL